MGISFLLTTFLAIGYILLTLCREVPVSLSATYYELGKFGWVFQLVMVLVGMGLMPEWIALTPDGLQWLCFLSCGGLMLVGVAPSFKLPLEGAVHYVSAGICCACAVLWQVCMGLWDVTIWFAFVGGMLSLSMREKWCWWLECAVIGSLFANLWRVV